VTQTDNSSSEHNRSSLPSRLAWIALILATLYICYFHHLGAIGLVGPDEPRYAWIARDMVETGDWVTPRLYGKPWFEKPVLYYWGAALSFKLFGVNEAAARFPSAVSALLATLAIAWLAWRFYGAETARWLLLFLPTTVGMIGFSHAAATDMPFSAMLTIAMVCAAVVLGLVRDEHTPILPRTPWLALVLFGFCLGLAALAKGPAAIVLSGGAVLLWAIFTKRWRDALRCLHPVGIASFCLTALPWYIACARRNPDFFRVFIIEHNFKRYLTPEFQHIQPFWFYIPIVLIAFVPWTLVLVWSAAYGSLHSWLERRLSASDIFLLSWAAFCLLFFSVSKSKLPGYILPAIPSIGLQLARSYVVLVPVEKKYFRWLLSAWSILSLVAAIALFWLGRSFTGSRASAMSMTVIGCVLLLFALANLLLTLEKRPQSRLLDPAALCALPVFVPLLLFPTLSKPWAPGDLSGKTVAAEILARQIPCDRIYAAAMPRGKQFSLSFYLHHQVQDWSKDTPKDGYLLLANRNCGQYVKPPWACENESIELKSSGWFLYPVRRAELMDGLGPFGRGRSDDSVRNGQSR
jgi:4-amino-4-deoxy-L-arabinose transferase-like glycosyltransferase